MPKAIRMVLTLIASGPAVVLSGLGAAAVYLLAGAISPPLAQLAFGVIGALSCALMFLTAFVDGGRMLWRHFPHAYAVVLLVGAALLYVALREDLWSWVPFVIALTCCAPLMYLVGAALSHWNVSLLDPAPLRVLLETVTRRRVTVPLFVTVARHESFFDPDDLEYRAVVFERSIVSWYEPMRRNAIVPGYIRIDPTTPAADFLQALLDSTALPLGLVGRTIGQKDSGLVDGGVADNLPWYPCIELLSCDEIVIVRCNPNGSWSDARMREEWARRCRELNVATSGHVFERVRPEGTKHPRVLNDPPKVVPLRAPSSWPKRVFVISPERALGGMLTGTMNFSRRKAERLLNDGFARAKDAIATWG
jgi:hypothetical protein